MHHVALKMCSTREDSRSPTHDMLEPLVTFHEKVIVLIYTSPARVVFRFWEPSFSLRVVHI